MKSRNQWMKWAAAAALVLFLGLVVWMVLGRTAGRTGWKTYETVGADGQVGETEQMTRETVALTTAPEPETKPEPETEPVSREVNLLFAGDVLLSDHVLNAYDRAGGIGGVLDEPIREEIRGADYFVVNEEFPFSERGTAAADKQYTFRLPPSRVHILQEMEIDLVTLANNHALDFGTDALLDTCDTLDQAGIRYVGAGENLERARRLETVELGGKTIGFLGASRVIPVSSWGAGADKPGMLVTYDPAMVLEDIAKAKEICDYVIVYVHWGIERNTTPETYQRTMGKQYIDAGADAVIGSHPHVLQGMEFYQGKPILYSLGNFVFGSSIPKTMLVKLTLSDDGISVRLLPCTSSGGYTRMVTEEETVQKFYQEMTSLSFDVTIDENGTAADRGDD